jgi:hypothetical protein
MVEPFRVKVCFASRVPSLRLQILGDLVHQPRNDPDPAQAASWQ